MIWRLSVDLRGRARWRATGWWVLGVGAALLAWQGLRLAQQHAALQAERDGVARLARAAQRPAPAMSAADVRRHAQFEPVTRHLAAPWDDLLELLEGTGSPRLQLVHLAADAETGRVALTAHAHGVAELSRYLLKLEAARPLADVQLVRHERGETRDAPMAFDIEAGWRGVAVPAARPAPEAAAEPRP